MGRIAHIFRWDLDKTYLKTEFATVRDLVRTARLTAEQRENVPGSAALIRAIRDAEGNGAKNQVFFISGSPEQLRGVIEKKFALDGFMPDGFVLKPAVSNILRGRFRAVRNQTAYKLGQLLAGRAEAPVGTQETLFGDDAESDAFVYSLFADVISGKITGDELRTILRKTGAYSAQIQTIEESLEAIVHEDPVRRIVIHLDQHTPPVAFQPFFPRVVPIYNHLQTAIVLNLDGTLPAVCIRAVARELIGRYGYDVPRLGNLAEDILRRRRIYGPLERLESLADHLRALPPLPKPASEDEDRIDCAVRDLIEVIAGRAIYLKDRPIPADVGPTAPRTDYLELWTLERERHEEAKRARKLAQKISRNEERAAAAGKSPPA